MKIITLENGDRRLELSEYERDTLIEVATYLRDNYDDLDFGAKNFTLEQVEAVLSLLNKPLHPTIFSISLAEIKLIKKVFREVNTLVESSVLDENEDLENISSDLFNLLFDNLGTGKYVQEVTS